MMLVIITLNTFTDYVCTVSVKATLLYISEQILISPFCWSHWWVL